MHSVTTDRFRKAFDMLPDKIKKRTRQVYTQWQTDPYHPSLAFKQGHITKPIFSVRVGLSYSALGIKGGNTLIWWIGSHEDYNKLIDQR